MSIIRSLGLLLLFIAPTISHGYVLFTEDVLHISQSIINTGRTLLEQAKTYERQFEQLRAAWTQIENQVHMIEAAVQNLKRIPEGLNFLDLITLKGNELSRLLSATEGMSFGLDRAVQQFGETYTQLVCTSTTPEIQAAYARMRELQMGSNKSAIQLQSIQANVLDAFTRLCALVSGSVQAQGNLDIQQIQAQQAALAAQQQAQADAAHAASERVRALREAERMVKEEMTRCQQERFFATGTTPAYVADTRLDALHTFTWAER